MDTIIDRFGVSYANWRMRLCEGATVYHVLAGNELVACAYLRVDLSCFREVLA